MRENNQRQIHSAADSYLKRSYYGLMSKSEASVDSDSNWLITLSDVFTLLLVFMVVFLVMTKNTTGSDESVTGSDIKVMPDVTYEKTIIETGIRDEIAERVSSLDLGEQVDVLAKGREVVVIMKEKITFMPAEADVLEGSHPVLGRIAEIINSHPEFLVEISGHTDNVPIKTPLYPSNWELSVARSANVLKFFINTHSIDPSRLSIKGYADQKPLTSNDTPENRARNRRVEIKFTKGEV
jgi:chemotaxis protein MotB